MKSTRNFLSKADVNMRLNDTVIKYEGRLYHAYMPNLGDSNDQKMWLLLNDFRQDRVNQEPKVVHANDPNLDLSSIPLGFVQIGNRYVLGETGFFFRPPHRKQKQAVSGENSMVRDLIQNMNKSFTIIMLYNKTAVENLEGNYKSKEEVLDRMLDPVDKAEYLCLPVARDFAFLRRIQKGPVELYMKTQRIGRVMSKEHPFVELTPEFRNTAMSIKLDELGIRTL